ncbi:short-chain dehydrogenase reductase [Klebsormidium nitens]|uniref:Short-chain dehydrogenase reductase n=1 Tax=Klebsormidium nitens TaxID=105231 RepID=A0A1Y1IQ35_KLENI|nr:short-chain dehydrogenase reductase [Klebsormidium nitens]|eukprot:GAQ91341.1 short-chain dehydrogenase reductase [Klebsormidium nitens]
MQAPFQAVAEARNALQESQARTLLRAIMWDSLQDVWTWVLNCTYAMVLYPIGVLSLLWIAPTLAVLRRLWRMVSWERSVRGKAVVIHGASSGIGEHIAYEFAMRGANLVLAARRMERLHKVTENCFLLGASDVTILEADVQKEADCKKIIDRAVDKYGTVDILVNNAGVAHSFLVADAPNWSLDAAREVINTTFWGHVYPTYYALPYLRATGGQLLNIISVASFIPYPRMGIYNAAKHVALGFFDTVRAEAAKHTALGFFDTLRAEAAKHVALGFFDTVRAEAAKHAALGFFDTLRAEVGSSVTVTNVLPGWVVSEMTEGKFLDEHDQYAWDQGLRDEHVGPWPVLPTKDLAEIAVRTALKRERGVVVPFWYTVFLYYRIFAPEVMDFGFRLLILPRGEQPAPTKKIVQMAGHDTFNIPEPGTQKRSTEELKMT